MSKYRRLQCENSEQRCPSRLKSCRDVRQKKLPRRCRDATAYKKSCRCCDEFLKKSTAAAMVFKKPAAPGPPPPSQQRQRRHGHLCFRIVEAHPHPQHFGILFFDVSMFYIFIFRFLTFNIFFRSN